MKNYCNTCKHRPKREPRNYSKTVLAAMIALWFAVAMFGMIIVFLQAQRGEYSSGLDGLFGYVGLPMGGGIVAYLIKSAVENREKIRGSNTPTVTTQEDCVE